MTDIEKIDNENIKKYKDIDFEEDDPVPTTFTCLMCKRTVNYKECYSFEGHNLCCKSCVKNEINNKHIISDTGRFMIKFIHMNKNIWDILPAEHFGETKNE